MSLALIILVQLEITMPDRQYITRTIHRCMPGKVDRRLRPDRRQADRRAEQAPSEPSVHLTAEEIAALLVTH